MDLSKIIVHERSPLPTKRRLQKLFRDNFIIVNSRLVGKSIKGIIILFVFPKLILELLKYINIATKESALDLVYGKDGWVDDWNPIR